MHFPDACSCKSLQEQTKPGTTESNRNFEHWKALRALTLADMRRGELYVASEPFLHNRHATCQVECHVKLACQQFAGLLSQLFWTAFGWFNAHLRKRVRKSGECTTLWGPGAGAFVLGSRPLHLACAAAHVRLLVRTSR